MTRHWLSQDAQAVTDALHCSDRVAVFLSQSNNLAITAVVCEQNTMAAADELSHVWVLPVVIFGFCAAWLIT